VHVWMGRGVGVTDLPLPLLDCVWPPMGMRRGSGLLLCCTRSGRPYQGTCSGRSMMTAPTLALSPPGSAVLLGVGRVEVWASLQRRWSPLLGAGSCRFSARLPRTSPPGAQGRDAWSFGREGVSVVGVGWGEGGGWHCLSSADQRQAPMKSYL